MPGAVAALSSLILTFPGRRTNSVTPQRRKVGRRSATMTAQIELNPLPFSLESLEPYISRQTMELQWGKHRSHVEWLSQRMLETKLDGKPLEDIVIDAYNKGNPIPGFNDAAEIWNHDFFWHSMKPGGGGKPSGNLLKLIERDFGSFELFLKEFKLAATTQIGSGWVWLTYKANRLEVGNAVNPFPSEEDNKLVVAKTFNAMNPLLWDYTPLLAIDLWEHAYYLDYENRRLDYVTTLLEKLVSWEVVSSRLEMAIARAAGRASKNEQAAESASEFELREREENDLEDSEGEMYPDSENDEWEAE